MPIIDASHFTSNNLLKSGSAKTRTKDNFSLIDAKLCSTSVPQWNFPFFMHSVIGAMIQLKFLKTAGRMLRGHGSYAPRQHSLE